MVLVLTMEFNQSIKELDHHNSTTLFDILGNILKSSDLSMNKRTIAKDRLHDCVFPLSEPSNNISMWHKLIWSTIFIAMLIVAIIGNSIVIWIVTGKWSFKKKTIICMFIKQVWRYINRYIIQKKHKNRYWDSTFLERGDLSDWFQKYLIVWWTKIKYYLIFKLRFSLLLYALLL